MKPHKNQTTQILTSWVQRLVIPVFLWRENQLHSATLLDEANKQS